MDDLDQMIKECSEDPLVWERFTRACLRELEEDPGAYSAWLRLKSGRVNDTDLARVMPYIPEFRKNMLQAENARAEGRTVPAEEILARLEQMEE